MQPKSLRLLIFAVAGLAIMVYGVAGLRASGDAGTFGFLNRELRQLSKKNQAQADSMPVSEATKEEIADSSKPELSARYIYYRNCLEGPKPCEGFPSLDGDLYLSEVRSQMLSEMTALYEEIKNDPSRLAPEHETSAQLMLTDATPDMQVVGLQLLEMFPISEYNLDLVAQTTEDAFDLGVVNAGLQSLERYKNNPAYKTRVTAAFVQQIGLGVNDHAAIEAIEKLPGFLTQENRSQFSDLLAQLREASRKSAGVQRRYKALQNVLSKH